MKNIEIQIDGGLPFVANLLEGSGVEYGTTEMTQEKEKVRHFKPTSMVAVLHYSYQDRTHKNYYRDGRWVKNENGEPRFCVSGLLES